MSETAIRLGRRRRGLILVMMGLSAVGVARAADPPSAVEQLRAQATKALLEGIAHTRKRQFSEALPCLQKALDLWQRLPLQQNRENLAVTYLSLGACLVELGRPAEALPYAEAAKAQFGFLNQKGSDRAIVAALAGALGLVARCQRALGRPHEALQDYQSALRLIRSVYGKRDHYRVMGTLMNVAGCLAAVGRAEEAAAKAREALAMARRLYGRRDHPAVATCLNALGTHLCRSGKPAEALPHHQAALQMRQRLAGGRDDPTVALYRSNLGMCLQALGRNEEALGEHQAALKAVERLFPGRDHAVSAQVRNNLAGCLARLERWREAAARYERAVAAWHRLHAGRDHPNVAAGLKNLGHALAKLGRHADALVRHLEAVRMLQRIHRGRDHPDVAGALNYLAATLVAMWRFDEALEHYRAVLAMRRRAGGGDPRTVEALVNVGMCLAVLDRQSEALPMLEKALATCRRHHKDTAEQAELQIRLMVAAVLGELGRTGEALPHLRAVAAAQQKRHGTRPHADVAGSQLVLGTALGVAGKHAEALKHLRVAAAMAHELHFPNAWTYDAQVGWLLSVWLNRPKEAAEVLEKAIRAMEWDQQQAEGHELDRLALLGMPQYRAPFEYMARAQLALGRPEKALEYVERGRARFLRQLLEQAERQGGGDVLGPVEALARRRNNGKLLAAVEAARRRQTQARQAVARLTAQVRFLRGRDALTPAERARWRELGPKLKQAREAHLAARGAAFALAQRHVIRDLTPPSVDQITALVGKGQRLLIYSTTETETLVLLVSPSAPKVRSFSLPDSARKELSQAVRDYVGGILCEGLLARTKDPQRIPDAVLRARGVRRRQVRRHDRAAHAKLGHRLFRTLLPEEVWAEARTAAMIYLVPDGPLHGLPFEALVVAPPPGPDARERAYWLDAGPPIAYGPSATVLLNRRAARDQQIELGLEGLRPRREAVLLGDAIFHRGAPATQPTATTRPAATPETPRARARSLRDPYLGRYGGLQALPGTRAEVERIQRTLAADGYRPRSETGQVVVLLGDNATRSRLFREARSCRYLHLATHGLVDASRQAIYSSLALTEPLRPTADDFGLLTLADLLDHWRGHLGLTELVVLSACETLRGRQEAGEGVFGLPWGFMYAGAPAVIASLWQVADESTAELMATLYAELPQAERRGGALPKLTAFVRARRALRKRTPQPYFWAPFIYTGDPR